MSKRAVPAAEITSDVFFSRNLGVPCVICPWHAYRYVSGNRLGTALNNALKKPQS